MIDELARRVLDNLYDGVYFVDRDRTITYWNNAAERLTGFMSDEVVGTHCYDDILRHVDEKGTNLCKEGCPLHATLADGAMREAEVYLHHKDGHRVPVLIRVSPIHDSRGQTVGAVEVFSDNFPKVAMRENLGQLQRMALLDPLTGLANRRYMGMRLQVTLDELHRYGWPFGVIFADIDRFKKVNDSYGHEIGDRVLKVVANTFLHNVRSVDIVGRWGGEEFLGLIANVDAEQLYSIADKLRVLVEESRPLRESIGLRVTVSIGAALARSGDTAERLLVRADELLYQSKRGGRNRVSVTYED